MLHADGSTERVIVGPDLRNGQCVQLLIAAIRFTPRGWCKMANGFLGPAPSGRVLYLPTSKLVISTSSLRSIPPWLPICATSLRRPVRLTQHSHESWTNDYAAIVQPGGERPFRRYTSVQERCWN
jgi:hypothetical protein